MLKPFKFWCQHVLPLVYDDSLSYYEMLCKITHYINNLIKDVNDLSTSKYVPNFGGEWNFENSYSEYTVVYVDGGLSSYISKQDVPANTPIDNEDYWQIIFNANEIENQLNEIENNVESLTAYNEKRKYYVTPEEFGAIGDGENDDTSAITAALNNAKGLTVIFSNKIYKVTSPLIVDFTFIKEIDLGGCIIRAGAAINEVILVKNSRFENKVEGVIHGTGTIDCNALAFTGITIENSAQLCRVCDITIRNFSRYGIYNSALQCFFDRLRIVGIDNVYNTGIMNTTTDNQITNCFIYRVHTGLDIVADVVNDLHVWIDKTKSSDEVFDSAVGIKVHNYLIGGTLYVDAYKTAVYADSNTIVTITNLAYITDVDMGGLIFNVDLNTKVRLGTYKIGVQFSKINLLYCRTNSTYPAPQVMYGAIEQPFPRKTGLFELPSLLTCKEYNTPYFGAFEADNYYIIGYIKKATGKCKIELGTNDFVATILANTNTTGTDTLTLLEKHNTAIEYEVAFGEASIINNINCIPVLLKASNRRPYQYCCFKSLFESGACIFMPSMRRDISDCDVYDASLLPVYQSTIIGVD